jgi:hypothetical protein
MTKNGLIDVGTRMLSDTMHRAGEIVRGHIRDDVMADLRESVLALQPDESGRISKGLVIAMIDGDVK